MAWAQNSSKSYIILLLFTATALLSGCCCAPRLNCAADPQLCQFYQPPDSPAYVPVDCETQQQAAYNAAVQKYILQQPTYYIVTPVYEPLGPIQNR